MAAGNKAGDLQVAHVGADKDDAGVGGGRPDIDARMGAGVDAHAGEQRRCADGVLKRRCGQGGLPSQ